MRAAFESVDESRVEERLSAATIRHMKGARIRVGVEVLEKTGDQEEFWQEYGVLCTGFIANMHDQYPQDVNVLPDEPLATRSGGLKQGIPGSLTSGHSLVS